MTLKRKGLLFLPLFFLLCVPPVFSQDGLYLSSPEVKLIRAELENMRLEVLSLRTSQEALRTDSSLLREKCTALENRLQTALQMLESSEQSVLELSREAENLRTQLQELKQLYSELTLSLTKQKKRTAFWTTTTAVLGVAVVVEGAVIWIMSK